MKNLIVLLFVILATTAHSQTIKLENYVYSDTDKNIVLKNNLGYYHGLTKKITVGVSYGFHGVYNNNNYIYNRIGGKLEYNGLFEDNGNLFTIEYYQLFSPIHENQSTYKLNYLFNNFNRIKFNIFSERDIVDVITAIDEGFTFMINGMTADFIVIEDRLTLTTGYANQQIQNIPEDVERDIYYINGDLRIFKNAGVSVNNRIVRSDENSIYFFQPNIFDKHLIGVYNTFLLNDENIVIRPTLSIGLQNLNGNRQHIFESKVVLRGWINDRFGFNFNAGYSNAVHDFGTYGYFMGNLTLQYKLN